jgi:hypothetical protein
MMAVCWLRTHALDRSIIGLLLNNLLAYVQSITAEFVPPPPPQTTTQRIAL